MDIKKLTIKSVKDGLEKGLFSVEELKREFHYLISEENKKLNAFLSFYLPDDNKTPVNKRGALYGVPFAVKDNILIEGKKTTAASKILENYVSTYDATVVEKLNKAGAWFLGKTNLDEFAMGASTENSAFGVTKNPHNFSRVPGGSSGGSAAAVASGLAVCALGSDTGGSIRQPASFCGIVGLKPTYGRVSRHGLIAMTSSFDQIGPMTKNVYDAALIMNIIAGKDPLDSTSVSLPIPDYTKNLGSGIKGLRVGVPKEFLSEELDSGIREKIEKAVAVLEQLGVEVKEISLPYSKYSVPAYYVIVSSEVSSNLARYDGIKYGLSSDAEKLFEVYTDSRSRGFGDEAKRRIMMGTFSLSAGYFEAYYAKASKISALIKNDFDKTFKNIDIIVGPTTPTTAFKIGENKNDPVSMYLADIYTAMVNLAGLPAISIPCGKISGLPVGLQIIGKPFEEETVLRAAYAYEQHLI